MAATNGNGTPVKRNTMATPPDVHGEMEPAENAQPYVLESDEFRSFLERRRAEAITIVDTLDIEVERLQAQIMQRQQRREDLMQIVGACDAGLVVVPRPELNPPSISHIPPGQEPPPVDPPTGESK